MALRQRRFLVVLTFLFPAAILLGAYGMGRQSDRPIGDLLRDPLAVAGAPFYLGAVSNLGTVLWAGACAIAGVVSVLPELQRPVRRFFAWFAAVTLLLALDDLYQVHEGLFPWFGLPSKAALALYGSAALACIVINRRFILRTHYALLAVAFGAFGTSLTVDLLDRDVSEQWAIFVEDGAKFIGIVAWFAYLSCTAIEQLTQWRKEGALVASPAARQVSAGVLGAAIDLEMRQPEPEIEFGEATPIAFRNARRDDASPRMDKGSPHGVGRAVPVNGEAEPR